MTEEVFEIFAGRWQNNLKCEWFYLATQGLLPCELWELGRGRRGRCQHIVRCSGIHWQNKIFEFSFEGNECCIYSVGAPKTTQQLPSDRRSPNSFFFFGPVSGPYPISRFLENWAPGFNCPGPNCPGSNLPRTHVGSRIQISILQIPPKKIG